MSWRDYFIDNPEMEEMFVAFKERLDEGDDDFDIYEATEERQTRQEVEEADDHYFRWEKEEHYREQWAKKKGYTFKPKPYDLKGKYR